MDFGGEFVYTVHHKCNHTIVVQQSYELVVDFKVYPVRGESEDGERIYECGDDGSGFTRHVELANDYLHGFVKWDGCSNWYFDEQDTCMLHFCGVNMVQDLMSVMCHCYEVAEDVLDRDLTDL